MTAWSRTPASRDSEARGGPHGTLARCRVRGVRVGASKIPARHPRLAGVVSGSARGTATRGPWWLGPVAVVAAFSVAYVLRSRAVVECRIGINAGAALLGPALGIAALALVGLAVLELVRWWARPAAYALLVVVVTLVFALGWLGQTSAPVGYPVSVPACGGLNRPPGWPAWLPG